MSTWLSCGYLFYCLVLIYFDASQNTIHETLASQITWREKKKAKFQISNEISWISSSKYLSDSIPSQLYEPFIKYLVTVVLELKKMLSHLFTVTFLIRGSWKHHIVTGKLDIWDTNIHFSHGRPKCQKTNDLKLSILAAGKFGAC